MNKAPIYFTVFCKFECLKRSIFLSKSNSHCLFHHFPFFDHETQS